MARLSKQQVGKIINDRPAGTTPEEVINGLVSRGHTLEGFDTKTPAPSAKAVQADNKGVVSKVAGFLGIEKVGQRIGSELVRFTPEGRKLKELRESGQVSEEEFRDITTGGVSTKEAIGSGALALANIALPFSGKAIQVGSKAIKIPQITQRVVRGKGAVETAKQVGRNVARSGAVGAGFGTASGLERDESVVQGALMGALVGGAFPLAGEAIRGIAKGAGAIAKLLGQTFSGTPQRAIDFAVANPQRAKAGLQRALQDDNLIFKVANEANSALSSMKNKRDTVFTKGLQTLDKELKGTVIDPTPFNEALKKSLKRFDVLLPNGKIDPNSVISETREINAIKQILKRMETNKDFTPEGYWKIKKFVNNKYRDTASGEFQALVIDIENELRDTMVNNVKGFDKLLRTFEADSSLLGALQKELGVKAGARGVTIGEQGGELLIQDNTKRVMNALNRAFKGNAPLAEELLKEMEKRGGKNITDDLVGLYFKNYLPPLGLQSILGLGAGSVAGFTAGGVGAVTPLLGLASPRLVGAGARGVGAVQQGLRNVPAPVREGVGQAVRQTGFGAGLRTTGF